MDLAPFLNSFRALRHRNFRLFVTGQFISLIGTWMQTVALGWLIYRLTGSPFLLGLAGFLGQVPSLLTRAGTLLDQLDDITRDGLVLSPDTVEAIGKAEARRNRWTSVALWVIAALLAWIAWMAV